MNPLSGISLLLLLLPLLYMTHFLKAW